MAKIHKIRRRIKSVGKINQITKAMEKVAASKMRRALSATLRSRPYAASAAEVLAHLFTLTQHQKPIHPLFAQRTVRQRLLIVMTSDRGLAGAYNSNIIRRLTAEVTLPRLKDAPMPDVIVIGRKGAQAAAYLASLGKLNLLGMYQDVPTGPTLAYLQPVITTIIERSVAKQADRVELLYTDFISSLRQVVTLRQLLPVDPQTLLGRTAEVGTRIQESLFEPSPQTVLEFIVPRLVGVQVYQALLEAIASEQAMRMLAMKNASDNAGEIIDDLTLVYNGARQAAITQELAEITVGAQAVQ